MSEAPRILPPTSIRGTRRGPEAPRSVTFFDLVSDSTGLSTGKPTTAHVALHKFYGEVLQDGHKKSILERLAAAPSPFAIEGILQDALLFASKAPDRKKEQWRRAAIARVYELRGWIYTEGDELP